MKWKCKLSGTVIDLPDWEEANMAGHDGYEKVVEVVEEKKEQPVKPKAKKETE